MSLAPLLVVLALVAPPLPTPPPESCLVAPVAAHVTRGFEQPACRWCAGHRGLRYATSRGAPVVAAVAGRVTFAGTVAGQVWVTVSPPDGRRITVGPLMRHSAVVGQHVRSGEQVGRAGSWLLFTVRAASTGAYLDPVPLLTGRRAVPRLVPEDGAAAPPRASVQPGACAHDGGGPPVSR